MGGKAGITVSWGDGYGIIGRGTVSIDRLHHAAAAFPAARSSGWLASRRHVALGHLEISIDYGSFGSTVSGGYGNKIGNRLCEMNTREVPCSGSTEY